MRTPVTGRFVPSWTLRRGATAKSVAVTVRGRLGAGGKVLKVRTGDGDIRLKAS